MAGSGYTECGCHDCFDVVVSSDMTQPELCAECKEAGCVNHTGRPGFLFGHEECQRIDAYADVIDDDYPGYDPFGPDASVWDELDSEYNN